MKKKLLILLVLFGCLFLAGCAANSTFLMTNQKQLGFKPEEGGVLLSFDFTANYQMVPNAIYVQEINQYKHFNQRKIQTLSIPKPDAGNGVYLLNAKLPQGRYLLTSVGGMTTGFFSKPVFASCVKMFDVRPGEITYIGKIKASPEYSEIEDNYSEDVKFFTTKYPILASEKIKNGLMY
jgi:hypothetical protein